ncbi:hypothetical protein LJR290_002970 [Variovorax sp. LjRoot290]|uniref:hypothetical protein n=1 Tax=Variovorax sp. LjRoot290 TaxID=3342316 RepID=UPI003ED145DD
MEKDSKSGLGGLSGNGLIAVMLLLAGALFVREAPLETTRLPAGEPRFAQHFSLQDVDARLWQDPFGAVAKGRVEARKNDAKRAEADDARRTAADLAREIRSRQPVEILAVMLPGGPYSENVESRRRGRYAVLAGLNASRLSPVDTEHLGYFFPPPVRPGPYARSQEPIPYEWFEPTLDARGNNDDLRRVLVMWLRSEAFDNAPFARMAELARPFLESGASWRVIGPNGSDGLKAMIDEAAKASLKGKVPAPPMRFYSPYATVPDDVLLPDAESSLADFFESRGALLVRTIGNDGGLATRLIDELELRGLRPLTIEALGPDRGESDPPPTLTAEQEVEAYRKACRPSDGEKPDPAPSHVAVVAEWDTLYGRSLRREFRPAANERGFCINSFNYVRGLDGQLPAGGQGASDSASGGKQAPGDKDATRRKDGTFIERAEGQSQFDYLRRLAVQMREKDRRVRAASADGMGLRAIGVLGNDVHDKLLVLQALKPEFPNAIFFTTDLDARFLHPREQAWTRNLIVASNFGLRLRDELQGGAPPFRDSYQVSTFLTTRIAMDDARHPTRPLSQAAVGRWFKTPRIFEIGRTEAFEFYGRPANEGPQKATSNPCRGEGWTACEDVHPPASARYPMPREATLVLIASLLVLALWAPALFISLGARRFLGRFVARAPDGSALLARYAALAVLVVLLQLELPLWLAAHWQPFAEWLTREGKPLTAFEGISLWPTEAIRVLNLVLCLYLLFRGWGALTRNLDEITREFHLGRTRRELIAEQREAQARLRWWQKLAQVFSMRFVPAASRSKQAAHGMLAPALDFWKRYVAQNRLSARLLRTTAYVAAALPWSYLIVLAFDEERSVPYRGDLSLAVHDGLRIPSLVAMYFLVFFVVDATAFCVGFVRGLREQAANWPEATLDLFEAQTGIPRAHLDNWVDLQFIALRTRSVTHLIYYPFIVISLLLLSRSAVFDRWTMPVSTIVLSVGGAVVALGCALALRLAAEASRRHALDLVKDALMRANAKAPAAPGEATPKQLELLQSRIESLRMGAFAPFWQQPLVKAVLLPFATLGGSTLLDYLALANI